MSLPVATHWRPHFTEILAIRLKEKYGDGPAEIILTKNGFLEFLMTESGLEALNEFDQSRVEFIGIARGKLDHHTLPLETCAATLKARQLGIDNNPELHRILKFALRRNTKGGQPLDLDDVVGALHNIFPENPKKVFDMINLVINAEIREGAKRPEKPDYKESFRSAVVMLKEEVVRQTNQFAEHVDGASSRIIKYLDKRCDGNNIQAFELVDVVALLLRAGLKSVPRWIETVVGAELTRQYEFYVQARAWHEKSAREEIVKCRGVSLKLIVIKSPHRLSTQYASFAGAAVVINKNPETGHVQISRIKKRTKKPRWMRDGGDLFTLHEAVALLRKEEQVLNGVAASSEYALREQDGPNGADIWYYEPRMDKILNGSLTHPDRPPTKLPLDTIVRLVKQAITS